VLLHNVNTAGAQHSQDYHFRSWWHLTCLLYIRGVFTLQYGCMKCVG